MIDICAGMARYGNNSKGLIVLMKVAFSAIESICYVWVMEYKAGFGHAFCVPWTKRCEPFQKDLAWHSETFNK